MERIKEFFNRELWTTQIEETKKKNTKDVLPFEFMSSKTVVGAESDDFL
jgi:hypothetical protein